MGFLEVLKKMIFNEIGSAGEEAVPVEEAVEEAVEESSEVVEEASPESEEVVEVQAESEEELEEEIKEALEDGASEEEVKDMIRQFTLKVDGKEFVKEIDLGDEDEIRRQLQLAHKGQKSTQELQELKKMYSSELLRLQQDPFAVLKELDPNFDPLDLSASYIDKLMKEQEMSPEEKAERQRQSEFEQIKAERDALKKEREDQVKEAEMSKLAAQIEDDIMDALDGDSELVADRDTVALVAENLMWAAERGMEDITAKDVLPTVKAQLQENFQKSAARFKDPSILKKYMGDDLLNKLREERIEQAKKVVKSASSINKGTTPPKKEEEEKRTKVKLSNLFR